MTAKYRQATLAIHGDESHQGKSEPVTIPIYQSSTYVFPDTKAMESCMKQGVQKQHVYVRYGNPAQDQLNKRLALLEGSEDALVFSSGMAAITNGILSAVKKGDEVLAVATLYGQTLNFLREGLPDDPFHPIARKQMKGFGGVVTAVVEGGLQEAMRVVDSLKICLNATSLGGVETLVSIPVISSHAWQTSEELELAKILPQMIRFSVGLEDPEDIIADCDQALAGI